MGYFLQPDYKSDDYEDEEDHEDDGVDEVDDENDETQPYFRYQMNMFAWIGKLPIICII